MIKAFIKKILPAFLVKRIEIYNLEKRLNKTKKTKEYLLRYLSNNNYSLNENIEDYKSLPVWQLWLQGEDNVPPLVKVCLQSIAENNKDRKIIILNRNNIFEYISLPDFIIEKYNNGIISHTHFSDIIRVCLLCEYGGTWIDSTVLMTGKMPPKIVESSFFCFSSPKDSVFYNYHLFSSWFIHSQPKHPFMLKLRDMLFSYWKQENELKDYFLLHICFSNMISNSVEMKCLWEHLYHLPNDIPHLLSHELDEPFSKDRFEAIKSKSCIHKLTYKIKPKVKYSFFNVLIEKNK